MEYPVPHNRRFSPGDLRWLGIALVAHSLLLLIPLRDQLRAPDGDSARIMVRLLENAAEQQQPSPAEEAALAPEPETAVELPAPSQETPDTPEEEQVLAENPLSEDGATSPPPMSLTRLLGLRDLVGARVPMDGSEASTTLNLGEPAPFERPGNWQRGTGARALAPFDNTFNGKTVPARPEVVDRWLAADGSHNVVVETPAGLRMCGRARPWNPMQPLVEHIMTWTVCGGDGKSGFKFKPRKPLDRDFIIPVAKDATEP